MTEGNKTLSLAQKITKPIPLAALGVLAAVVVLMGIITAGGAQIGGLGYAIVGGITFIAIVTLVIAVILTRPPVTKIDVSTKGQFSPGVVGDNYVINGPAALGDSKLPTNVAIRAKTEGDFSPGVVGGTFAASLNDNDGTQENGPTKHKK